MDCLVDPGGRPGPRFFSVGCSAERLTGLALTVGFPDPGFACTSSPNLMLMLAGGGGGGCAATVGGTAGAAAGTAVPGSTAVVLVVAWPLAPAWAM